MHLAKEIGVAADDQRVTKACLGRRHARERPTGETSMMMDFNHQTSTGERPLILTWQARGSGLQVIALEIYVSFR